MSLFPLRDIVDVVVAALLGFGFLGRLSCLGNLIVEPFGWWKRGNLMGRMKMVFEVGSADNHHFFVDGWFSGLVYMILCFIPF
jgi:hypothetical protein